MAAAALAASVDEEVSMDEGEDQKAGFGPVLTVTVILLSAVGTAANAACIQYIKSTFNWKKAAIFTIALYDAAFSLIGNITYAVTFALASNLSNNFGLCTFAINLGALQVESGFLIMAEIAAIRCAALVLGKRKRSLPEKTCMAVCLILHLAMCILILIFAVMQVANRAVTSKFIVICARLEVEIEDSAGKEAPARVAVILLMTLGLCFVTLACDAVIVYNVCKRKNSSVQPSNGNGISKKKWSAEYTVPVNATLSAMALLFTGPSALAVGYGLFGLRMDETTKNAVTMLFVAGCNAMRCPLQTALTFGAKVREDQESKAKRQERERQWAREEMELRRRNRATEELS